MGPELVADEVEIGVRSSHVVDAGDPVVMSRSTLRFPRVIIASPRQHAAGQAGRA